MLKVLTFRRTTSGKTQGTTTPASTQSTPAPATTTTTPKTSTESVPNQYRPLGVVDYITAKGVVRGWAIDKDSAGRSIDVHIYIDGPPGSGHGFAVTADASRPDVNTALKVTGNHGFEAQIPSQFLDGKEHTADVYAIDLHQENGPHTHLGTFKF